MDETNEIWYRRLLAGIVRIHQPYVLFNPHNHIEELDLGNLFCTGCSTKWPCKTIKYLEENKHPQITPNL